MTIEIKYELSKQPTTEEVLHSPYMSFWLKDRLKEALQLDLFDVTRDVEVLLAILHRRIQAVKDNNFNDLYYS